MRRNAFFCLCLCLCLLVSALLSACGTPSPEEPSDPAEESTEPSIPEDPNAAAARAYLEELLAAESDEWLSAERAEAIRACVKQLKTPILTEEDALRIAERAAAFYLAAWQGEKTVFLPACGVLEAIRSDTTVFSRYSDHEETYNALLSYTLYLFTPPEYVFWGSELRVEGWDSLAAFAALCLPFAGAYTNRTGALNAVREQKSCIRLYPLLISEGEHPLDFSFCRVAERLQNGESLPLELFALAGEDAPFRFLRAQEVTGSQLEHYTYKVGNVPVLWVYDGISGEPSRVCSPFSAEIVRSMRELTALFSSPILTQEDVLGLLATFHEDTFYRRGEAEFTLRLPGEDGEGEILLPPEIPLNQRARRALAYAIDLFTPPACRFADLFDRSGAYYALSGEGARYVLITEAYELYLVSPTGGVTPLYTAWEGDELA